VGNRRLVLVVAAAGRIDLHLGADRGAVGGVLTHVNVCCRPGAARVVVIVVPADHEAAARQRGDRRLVLAADHAPVDEELATELVTARIEALGIDAVAAAVVAAVIGPHHDEAAVGKHRHVGVGLVGIGGGVDPELAAERGAGGIEALGIDATAAAVLAFGAPHDDEAAAVEGRNRGLVLVAAHGAVDGKLGAARAAVVGVAAGVHRSCRHRPGTGKPR
jgi:hypothetical protein